MKKENSNKQANFIKQKVAEMDKDAIADFISHMENHIVDMPTGGYKQLEDSQVAITVGHKTLVFYDHAFLMQALINSLYGLLEEI